jgi:hypothetical protein
MEPEIRDMLQLTLELDPLAGVPEDDKMTRLSNKGITQLTYITSSNIQEFVQLAIEQDPKFPDLDPTKQRAVIAKMATVILNEQSKAKEVLDGIPGDIEQDQQISEELPENDPGQPTGDPGGTPNAAAEA